MVTRRSSLNSLRICAMENQDFTFLTSLPCTPFLSVCGRARKNPDRLPELFSVLLRKFQNCRQPVTGDTGNDLLCSCAWIHRYVFPGGNSISLFDTDNGLGVQRQLWQVRQRLQGWDNLLRYRLLLHGGGNFRC